MSLYYNDAPEYTIPFYEHLPRRPRGVFLSAALHALPLTNMDGLDCAKLPEDNPWHPPSSYLADCGRGFVIYVSADINLRILVTPPRGSGCNNDNEPECAPLYPLMLPLREGRNNIIWCSETSITMAPSNALDPWQELCSEFGNVLLFPPESQGYIQNYVFTGESYKLIPSTNKQLTQPTVMAKSRCHEIAPPRVSLLVPTGEVPTLKMLSLLTTGLNFGSEVLPYPGVLATTTIGLQHKILDRAITPPRCLCGFDYTPMSHDYTTGDIPDGPEAHH